MSSRAAKLEALGYALDKAPPPAAMYESVVVDGGLAYVSGALPLDGPDNLVFTGRVDEDVSLAAAQRAAALCAANILRVLHQHLGNLDRISRVVRLGGYVASGPGFTEQHLVLNAASQLMVEILGEAGRHSRAAVGVMQLPLGAVVEIDAIVRLTES